MQSNRGNSVKQPNEDVEGLKAEISLLKSNLKRIEKDNSELRKQISDAYKKQYIEESNIKRRLNMFQKEYKMKESMNNLRGQTQMFDENSGIDVRYALKQTLNIKNITVDEELKKLKFFRDYFFDDFYSIDSEDIISVLKQIDSNNKLFIEIYTLFCCKKEVFDAFLNQVFELPFFIKEKIYILENVPVDWVINQIQGVPPLINSFIKSHFMRLVKFICKVAATSPGLLDLILSNSELESILMSGSANSRHLSFLICKNKLVKFVDENNIHLFSYSDLQLLFGKDYFFFDLH